MATTIKATYKQYNGTDWDTVYFKTSAAQVGESNGSLNFLRPSTHTVNGKSFWSGSAHQGITLYGSDIKTHPDEGDTTLYDTITAINTNIHNVYQEIQNTYLLKAGGTITGALSVNGDTALSNVTAENVEITGSLALAETEIAFAGGSYTATLQAKDGTIAYTSDLANFASKSVATTSANGLMSSTDKKNLNTLVAMLEQDDSTNDIVDTITEVLAIFSKYPEGTDIVNLLATKQDADADLTAIAGLTGTSGLLKKTAANTWALDTNTYATQTWVTNKKYLTSSSISTMATVATSFTAANQIVLTGGAGRGLATSSKTIATSVTDSDNTIPTSGAVIDYIASLDLATSAGTTNIYTGSTAPTNMKSGDVWISY